MAELSNLSQTLSLIHIIGVDFNVKYQTWSRYINSRGQAFQNFILFNHLKIILPLCPTYWSSFSNRHPDNRDFFITNLSNHFPAEIVILNKPASNHTPILLLIGAQLFLKQNRPIITSSITNWNKFKFTISNKIILNTKLKSSTDVDQTFAKLSVDIHKSAKDSSI